MRILHTSDWHLGRTLHGVDLLEHQRVFLDHLVGLVHDRDIDVVLVAGDVYDRAVPAVPTVHLLSEALRRLSDLATVIVTPGNHDSAERLGFAAELMRPGLHIRASVKRIDEPTIVADEHGSVAFYGLPYLDPDAVRGVLADQNTDRPLPRSHEAVMAAAMDRVRADLATHDTARAVVVAHAFVFGGAVSESERDIRVGGVDSVPSQIFHGVDYVALGHLHGPQRVGGQRPVIRYSGSPLAFSFGERNHVKSSVIVDLDAAGNVTTELVPVPVPRRLAEVTDSIENLLDGRHDQLAETWLRVFVTDPAYPAQLFTRVKERFPHALAIHHTPLGGAAQRHLQVVTAAHDPLEIAAEFVEYATSATPTQAELAVLRSAYEQALATEASG